MVGSTSGPVSAITARLADYIAETPGRALPDAVAAKGAQHVLDTFGAMISGAALDAGRIAIAFARRFEHPSGVSVIGAPFRATPPEAALANGMMGHADETDDSHLGGRFHPGCAIVPAALAAAEMTDASGRDLLRAVVLGYEVGARVNQALGLRPPATARHSTHSLGTTFGAAAAAACLFKVTAEGARHVLSYAAQQASGIPFWQRDSRHVEKAFDFGGVGARNGLTAALLVDAGASAVDDPFDGAQTLFTAFADEARPELLVQDLGTRHEIMAASLKKWCVGSPIQSALDSMEALIGKHRLTPEMVAAITIHMPDDRLHIVDNRSMPDVCLQHLVALILQDRTITFASCHDYARMADPGLQAIRARMRVVPSAELTLARPARQAIVEIETTDGRSLRHHARVVRGTPDNPMAETELVAKVRGLIEPTLGSRSEALIDAVLGLDRLPEVTALRVLFQAA